MTDALVPPPRYRPAMLPEQRRMLVDTVLRTLPVVFRDFMTRGKQQIYHPEIVHSSGTSIAQAADFMARHEAYRLKHAALYYVAPDMTALAISAGRALPEYDFSAADLPAPYGFLVFDGPYPEVYEEPWNLAPLEDVDVPAHLTAVGWGPITDPGADGVQRPGVWFTYYSDRDASDVIAVERGVVTRDEVIERLQAYGAARFVYDNETMIFEGASWREIAADGAPAPGQPPGDLRPRVGPQILRTLLAASLLMREPLARTTSEPEEIFTRHERRRLHREGLTDQVRVVHLRQPERIVGDPIEDGEEHSRNYTCRWPVVGHWRRQWYPSEGRHRPRYIAPQIRGPKDMPLRVRETVRVWDR